MRFFKSVNSAVANGLSLGVGVLAMMANEVLAQNAVVNITTPRLDVGEGSGGLRLDLFICGMAVVGIAVCAYRYRPQQVVQEMELDHMYHRALQV